MEPGDSGGPVFDLYGRVIGLHSNIKLELESNFEIPVDVFRRYWSALMKAEDYTTLPPEDPMPADPLAADKVSYAKINSVELMLAEKESKLDDATIQLYSVADTSKAVGTMVSLKEQNKTYIISKNSLLPGEVKGVLANGKIETLKVIYRDDAKDLVLLELGKKNKSAIDFSAESKAFASTDM